MTAPGGIHAAPRRAAPRHAAPAGAYAVAPVASSSEREARDVAERVSTVGAVPWSFANLPVHAEPAPGPDRRPGLDVRLDGPGRPLEPELGALADPVVGASTVRVHTDASAADTARRAGAEAVTVGSDIAFAPGRYRPETREGRRAIAHELAHVAQGAWSEAPPRVAYRQGTGTVAAATTLAGLPEADRRRIQVVTTLRVQAPTREELKGTHFDKGTTTPRPANTTIALDPSVPAAVARGVTNLAGTWSTGTDPVLKPNTTLTVDLDLTAHGGARAPLRFTFNQPPAPKGGQASGRIIVEQLGATTAPAGTARPAEAKPGDPAPADPIADKLKAASITYSGYGGAEEQALRAAIALVPAAHLAAVSGLTFGRRKVDPEDPKVAGRYLPKEHRIVMYDNAFAAADVVFVEGGVAASYAARSIVHEIGHAVDLRPLATAYRDLEAATAQVNAKAGTFSSKAEKQAYDDAVKAETAAKQRLRDARSRSGTRTVAKAPPAAKKGAPPAPTDYEDVIGKDPGTNAFRVAVRKDGKDVSKYGEEDWQESYAEAYSLFVTSPTRLRALRPATYDYFVTSGPR